MAHTTKIATCCYCGTRAALVLDQTRHELTCANCGAPLHNMKRLRDTPRDAPAETAHVPERHAKKTKKAKRQKYDDDRQWKKRRVKKRKGAMRHFLEEAFDVIEDIFD
ncbi:MAG: hypothetical protein AAF665_15745 [Pseudomonadota bacterium]